MRRLVVFVAGALIAGLTTIGLAAPASAHDVLVGSIPAAGAELTTGPSLVRFDFDAPVQQGNDTIMVIGPDGTHWERTSQASVLGSSVLTSVAPLGPAGKYTAIYHVLSADSHPVSGSITFQLTRSGPGTPVSSASVAGSDGAGAVPAWVLIVIAVVVLAGVLYAALRPRRRTSS
ncbi:copper resistance CopC family protein [Amycolatopsis taiwanensis]|uniref:copper resistance CopC family protein n=1 Tax=Amycolatopsis taiwanensis TaxID=342230 RepID=UPI0004846FA8|nr:copper resistance CopC family protein [Amycolatopsis taiwanensis]